MKNTEDTNTDTIPILFPRISFVDWCEAVERVGGIIKPEIKDKLLKKYGAKKEDKT